MTISPLYCCRAARSASIATASANRARIRFHIAPWRGDAARRRLLESVQDVYGGFQAHGIHGAICVAIVVRDDLQCGRPTEAFEGLRVGMSFAALGLVEGEAHITLHIVGESLEIVERWSDPLHVFHHTSSLSLQ